MPDKRYLPESKHINLEINNSDDMLPTLHALASPVRLEIVRMLGLRSMYVNEIAELLSIPVSTAAMNIRVLEEAGVLSSELQPGNRGTMKLCSRRLDSVSINLITNEKQRDAELELSLPVGCYSMAEDIVPTCGLASSRSAIGEDDNPRSFFCPDRFDAQLIWFRSGFVTYHFSVLSMSEINVKYLEVSFEACSEAPMYRDPWKSDVDVSINGKLIGTWSCPSDNGGRRGLLNPPWWSDMSTQYGFLKNWRVDHTGTFLENMPVSSVTVGELDLAAKPYIAVRIGVSPEAKNVGGLNFFGRGFGDYAQDLVLRVGYEIK
jgi:predicted transcriptional regulator